MKTLIVAALAFALLPAAARAQGPVGTSGASASPSRPAPAATNYSTAPDYRLAAGDKLRIEVYKDTQLSQSLQVRPDGKITLPLLGDIPAAGRTSVELRDAIAGKLEEYIAKPVVTVIVTETMPQVVYVTGEVNKPGALPITTGQMSIIQAIAMAGGFTDFANKKDIRVLRKGAGGMQTLRFNYKEAIDDESRREPLALVAGDTVIVK
ncbi:MAG TPA: polysaccharide biosynthesis/export family protein [Vicinamibacterales bacterium]|nr:polysaccharide biosynthesis/export family protein [Vicinamibacterales bacterium]